MADYTAYFVSPTVVGLRVTTGSAEDGGVERYRPQPGDKVRGDGTVVRDGEPIGLLYDEPGQPKLLTRFDGFDADPEQRFFEGNNPDAHKTGSFELTSSQHWRFRNGEEPEAVWRKSKAIDTAQTDRYTDEFVVQHDLFLEFDQPLREGKTYTLKVDGLKNLTFKYDTDAVRSEALHVNQLGFAPGDASKVGYLSMWKGQNPAKPNQDGGTEFKDGQEFHLRDANSGKVVYTGEIELDKAAGDPTNWKLNFNQTDVYRLDFSDFDDAGSYVLQVDGVGTSFEFEISGDVWAEAFATSMAGFYNQRSGIELDEALGGWDRPRSLHPDDGFKIYQSTAQVMDTNMGLNLKKQNAFKALKDGATDEVVEDAWGGWHDAGDWDRRTQQLKAANDLLELAELEPEFARKAELAIPEGGGKVPDVIDEALWSLDVFRRLQHDDGGVPGGIESAAHPVRGEGSWMESQEIYAYAPDAWSSYTYAGVAARAAFLLEPHDAKLAKVYERSAEDAMRWAEANTPGYAADNADVVNARNLAAAELYRLDGDQRWHKIFKDSTSYDGKGYPAWNEHQYDATLTYARTDRPRDEAILERGLDDLLNRAEFLITTGDRGAFGQIVNPHTPYGFGYTSAVPADAEHLLVKAHALTGDERYLKAISEDAQFGLGANPDNTVFTTGMEEVGADRGPLEALIVDEIVLGGEGPKGITLFGGWNSQDRGDHWSFKDLQGVSYPEFSSDWPVHETWTGFTKAVPITEYAMHTTMGPTALTWGYLAANLSEATPDRPSNGGNNPPSPPPPPVSPPPPPPPPSRPQDDLPLIEGTNRGETLKGTNKDERIEGGAGNDKLLGRGGDDALDGGAGNDKLIPGGGKDVMTGGGGRDAFYGQIQKLNGTTITDFGDDDRVVVYDAKFNDAALSTEGVDGGTRLSIDADRDGKADAKVLFEGLAGGEFVAVIEGKHTTLRWSGEDGDGTGGGDSAQPPSPPPPPPPPPPSETLSGSARGDKLTGTDRAEKIKGLAGNDTLRGQGGDDTLEGGVGSDFLNGGLGRDVLVGGRGWDQYEGTLKELDGDTIEGFEGGERVLMRGVNHKDVVLSGGRFEGGTYLFVDQGKDGSIDATVYFAGVTQGAFAAQPKGSDDSFVVYRSAEAPGYDLLSTLPDGWQ